MMACPQIKRHHSYFSIPRVTSATWPTCHCMAVGCHHHRPQAGIVESDGSRRGRVQLVQRHSIAPDGSPALDDHKRAAGDVRQREQGLRRGDGQETAICDI